MTTLCEQGAGLAMLPCFLAEQSDRLVRFEPARVDLAVDLWIVIRKDMSGSPKVRLLVDFLTGELRKLRHVLNGGEARDAGTPKGFADLRIVAAPIAH
jgi:DNA-binding transcriptional LysR family regulator